MTVNLTTVIADPPTGRDKAVFFDHHDYAQSVILGGREVPWHDPVAYAAFFGQAQALLKPDVALLDLGRFYAHLVAANSALRDAMTARSRTGYALRTLLSDDETTRQVLEFASVFTKTTREPVVLHIPSPMQWLARTHEFSGAPDASELDADDAENASMYVADWLRGLAALSVVGVLLDDMSPSSGHPCVPVDLDTYTPVTNVTDHYRWTIGLRRAQGISLKGDGSVGTAIAEAFWLEDEQEVPAGDFFLAHLPPAAVPEDVLGRLALLD